MPVASPIDFVGVVLSGNRPDFLPLHALKFGLAIGVVYEHPSSDSGVWTVDKSEWVSWVENYIDTVPDADIMDVLEPYPVGFDEYDRMASTEVVA